MSPTKNSRTARDRVIFWAAIAVGVGLWIAVLSGEIRTTSIQGTINIIAWGLIALLGVLLAGVIVVAGPLMVNRKKRP